MLREQRTGRYCREIIAGEGMHKVRVKRSERGSDVTFCRTVARTRVVDAMPEIVDRFVHEAKKGSIPHVKALAVMGGIEGALNREDVSLSTTTRPRQSLAAYLMKEFRRQQRERQPQVSES